MKSKEISPLGNINELTDYIPKVLSCNVYTELVTPEGTVWSNDISPFYGTSFYVDGSKMKEGTGAGIYTKFFVTV